MVSWGSEVEETPPRLGEGRAEERGVRGATVSSSILRSCCDGRAGWVFRNNFKIISQEIHFSFWFRNTQFTHIIHLTGALIQKTESKIILISDFECELHQKNTSRVQHVPSSINMHTPPRGTSSPPPPPPSVLSPTPPSASPARAGTSPVTMATKTWHTAQSLNKDYTVCRWIFLQKNKRWCAEIFIIKRSLTGFSLTQWIQFSHNAFCLI